ncbi:sporulation protein, partial [Methylomonas sp. WSC-6]|nr:sporulation protein [Methylomonas sp. WSC-6]
MDQELKQRLIGAAVITALAAIFVPMLFDDPIDESGKSINELKIPELPAKAQDVEIMPLPEKVEDVATLPEEKKPDAPAVVYEGDEEADLERPRPLARITEKETAPQPAPAVKFVEPDAEEEDVVIQPAPVEPTAKPVKPAPAVSVAEA